MKAVGRSTSAALAIVAGAAVAAVACSDLDSLSNVGPSSDAEGRDNDSGADGNGSLSPGDSNGVEATGVMLVHGAAFPAIRVCFSNYPTLRPQPDATVMPQANLVGVDVGSVVRIDPPSDTPGERAVKPPGKVFVIDQSTISRIAGSDDEDQPCEALLCEGPAPCLRVNRDYFEAGSIDRVIGTDAVDVVAITGCGGASFFSDGVKPAYCGAPWNAARGNLTTTVVPLFANPRVGDAGLPVQLLNLAPFVDALGTTFSVSYGDLTGDAGALTELTKTPELFKTSPNVQLELPSEDLAIYGTHGFRIEVSPKAPSTDAGAPTVVEQSLADVQALSAPTTVPDAFYNAASNYVLLAVGNPSFSAAADAGTDPRGAFHLLAIPVKDPDADAGTDGGASGP